MDNMTNLDINKIMVYEESYFSSQYVSFPNRRNKKLTLGQAIEKIKIRDAEYEKGFLDEYYIYINESFFGTKNLGYHTFKEIILLLENAGFYDENSNYIDVKRVDKLMDLKDQTHKYNLKIEFSYEKSIDFTANIYQKKYEVYYKNDEPYYMYDYNLITKIYLDDEIRCDYISCLEKEYETKYFVYNINC
jgi:hypothetical protein